MSKRLLTILYPGFAEWEVVFPLFCVHPAIEAVYVSLDGRRVRGAMGFDMQVKGSAAEVNAAEFAGVYLPGGIDSASGRFPRQLADHEGLLGILRAFDGKEGLQLRSAVPRSSWVRQDSSTDGGLSARSRTIHTGGSMTPIVPQGRGSSTATF